MLVVVRECDNVQSIQVSSSPFSSSQKTSPVLKIPSNNKVVLDNSKTTSPVGPRIHALLRELDIEHLVLWGYPLGSHTHSYIHEAFFLAAESLNIDVHWIPVLSEDTPGSSEQLPVEYKGPTTKTLFISAGMSMKWIPELPSCWYLLHNAPTLPNISPERRLDFQFYTPDHRNDSYPVFDDFHRISYDHTCAFMPWATNLLPEQFIPMLPENQRSNDIVVIGQHGSIYEVMIEKFAQALPERTLFRINHNCSQEEMMQKIQSAWCAPALMHQWQKDHGYIPCRIMKNISYGAIPVTTSTESNDMLWGNTICDLDETLLARKFKEFSKCKNGSDLFHKASSLVKTRHTYLNRIEFLLTCLKLHYYKAKEEHKSPVLPPTVLHLTNHKGCESYLKKVGERLGWKLETICFLLMSTDDDNDSICNMTASKADKWWTELAPTIQRFSHVIVSDTAPISRILLQHMSEYHGKVIVWVCNRFDYAHGSKEAFPDPDWYRLVNQYHERVCFLSYTKVERMYALDKNVVWDNAFADAVIRPICTVDPTPPKTSFISAVADKSRYLFIPPYINDKDLINFNYLQKNNILYYQGRYNGASDLVGFKAILHIPYAPSNLSLFENWSLGLVYYIPSLLFMIQLMKKTNWFAAGNVMQNLYASEWYDPRLAQFFVFFDSWDDLKNKLANQAHVDKVDTVKSWIAREEKNGLFQWNLLIQMESEEDEDEMIQLESEEDEDDDTTTS